MIRALLMDWNGVVIDDEPVQMRAYMDVLKEHGVELTEEGYYASLGMDDRTFVRAAFERVGKPSPNGDVQSIVDAKFEKWQQAVSAELPLFEGIETFIEKMADDFALGIVSMASRREIDFVLDAAGLREHFSAIVSAEDVTVCKPDPECYRIGFKRLDSVRTALGHSPLVHGDVLAVEDSPQGIQAALAADLQALGVANTVSAERLRAAGAGAVAKDLRDWFPDSIRLVFK
jgi:beta-phosphoglucomutase